MRGVKYVNQKQGCAILDRQARKYLGVSGPEFLRKLDAGDYATERCYSGVARVAMLVPLCRTSSVGRAGHS